MESNRAKELFLEKMRQDPAGRWQQADDVVRFLRERAQRKGLSSSQSFLSVKQGVKQVVEPVASSDAKAR